MRRNTLRISIAMAAALCLPTLASAQSSSLQAVQVADVQTMKDKFVGLAEAFTAAQYDWRPMEGVRSVKDVLALIITECHQMPVAWGVPAPSGAAAGFGPEMQRTGALSRAQIIRELGTACDHMINAVRGMTEAQRSADSQYFGRSMPISANIMTATADMHEHLGQLIAYARTNEVVPPWSR
ncbi:MAG: hypothetical protein OEO79_08240 [Gemmatimonadota bacterium]|nr:hypothetical protein [Gemmatimonadota bacterium]